MNNGKDSEMDSGAVGYIEQFPILEHGLYANHAAIAPWPRATAQAVVDFAYENCNLGPEKYSHWLLRETKLRRVLAKMLNADSDKDIALLKNTTEGICTVANGINWQSGDNIVLPADEFPSNHLPWLALQRLGVELREVDIRAAEDPEAALIGRMDGRTRLLSVSAVQWIDGFRLRLKSLGDACKQNNVLFFVDAIQQLGALQLDVQACEIDFLAADGHKWMLAPEGLAVFYCRKSVRQQLGLNQQGWRMVDDPYQFTREDWSPSASATRFEAGTPNTVGQAALYASLCVLQDAGMDAVERNITENSRALCAGLSDISGARPVRPFDQSRVSGIVSFQTPDLDSTEVFRQLKRRQLSCALRANAIRLSPHFYQTGTPIQEMLNVVEDVLINM